MPTLTSATPAEVETIQLSTLSFFSRSDRTPGKARWPELNFPRDRERFPATSTARGRPSRDCRRNSATRDDHSLISRPRHRCPARPTRRGAMAAAFRSNTSRRARDRTRGRRVTLPVETSRGLRRRLKRRRVPTRWFPPAIEPIPEVYLQARIVPGRRHACPRHADQRAAC